MNALKNKSAAIDITIAGKHFDQKQILGAIDLTLKDSSFTVITGPSGAGKTTLLKIIAGLDKDIPSPISEYTVGVAFQEPRLLPWRTLRDNLALVCDPDKDIDQLLDDVGLKGDADLFPTQISLGMARRVSLARAFSVSPNLLLLDEPFVSLDEPTAERLREWLINFWQTHQTTVLMVTHNLREALQLADTIIVANGSPTTIQTIYQLDTPRKQRTNNWINAELPKLEATLNG